LYNTLALPIVLYDSETSTVKSKDKSRLTAAEMKFIRKTAKYTWRDHKTNEEILNKLKVTSTLDNITSYKTEGIQHVNRIPRSKTTKFIEKLCTIRHKKSGQTTEEAPAWIRSEQASKGPFP
jgi:hypothetical protein